LYDRRATWSIEPATGRNTLWIFLLIFVPLVGGLAYLIVEA